MANAGSAAWRVETRAKRASNAERERGEVPGGGDGDARASSDFETVRRTSRRCLGLGASRAASRVDSGLVESSLSETGEVACGEGAAEEKGREGE